MINTVDRGIDGIAAVQPCDRTHEHAGHWHRSPSFVWCKGGETS